MFIGEGNCEWREGGFIGRIGKGCHKGAEWISTFCCERGVMQGDCDAMSLVRCVHIGVLAIMWDELVKVSEGNSKDKVIGSVHDQKIKAKVECNVLFVRSDCVKSNEEISNDLRDELN